MDCNGIAADGCEINVATDPNHCHACGNVCIAATHLHLVAVCVQLLGCFEECAPGWADCDSDWTNGCECAV